MEENPWKEQEIKHGKWSKDEDSLLKDAVSFYGEKQWRLISKHVPGRTPTQCLHRWSKILKPGLVKGPWSPDEDELLRNWVATEGPTKWSACAQNIQGRSGKQCRERWFNILDPDVKKGEWKPEEDSLIFQLYNTYGPRWTQIAKHLNGRTENSIKNRFYTTIRKIKTKSIDVVQTPLAEDPVPIKREEPAPQPVAVKDDTDERMLSLLQQVQQLESLLHNTRREILCMESTLQQEEPDNTLSVKGILDSVRRS
mmetsp:Transcript_22588/g.40658  ORF Transcript_22588/g.40658 Transcript_22588/m.40658 type:complete len:254 (-) Transcript_22588:144-905(-)